MSEPPPRTDERQRACNTVLVTYLEALERGCAPSREEVLTHHPDQAEELSRFFTGSDPPDGATTTPARADADAGEHFSGTDRYVVQQRLGGGAMGVVYQAHDRQRNIVVALKVLRTLAPESIQRFKREFRNVAQVVHANLTALYELLATEDHWFFSVNDRQLKQAACE